MDINITAIERNIRFYGPPVALVLIALAVAFFTRPSDGVFGSGTVVGGVAEAVHVGALITLLLSLAWLSFRAWTYWRWERGELHGRCDHCGGPMSHREGAYGNYSKCQMCGATQKGWR